MNVKDLENELNKLDENFAFQIEQAEKDDTKASKDGVSSCKALKQAKFGFTQKQLI